MSCNEEYILMDVEVGLPKFQGIDTIQKNASDEVWRITTEDRQNYEKIFAYYDKNQSGRLSDEDMQ